jgi:hypothetical protein
MKKEIAERWVEKLKSGEFRQADGVLAVPRANGTISGYCCLGVLCEIAVEDGVISRVIEQEKLEVRYGNAEEFEDGDYAVEVLPESVRKWAGLELSNPRLTFGSVGRLASDLNDGERLTFEQIADLISGQHESL